MWRPCSPAAQKGQGGFGPATSTPLGVTSPGGPPAGQPSLTLFNTQGGSEADAGGATRIDLGNGAPSVAIGDTSPALRQGRTRLTVPRGLDRLDQRIDEAL